MKERPILMSAPMVRATIAGTKTQTRRVVKITHRTPGLAACLLPPVGAPLRVAAELCPYGQPGDRLWVRETWAYHVQAVGSVCDEDGPFVYRADHAADQHRLCDRWRPSIHMPRRASRITLEITGVRVERLQDINEADAIVEGIETVRVSESDSRYVNYLRADRHLYEKEATYGRPVISYASLWVSINGKGSWDANPWVWVVAFRRVQP